ncbi:uncharacterized protein [Anser cygnoides]
MDRVRELAQLFEKTFEDLNRYTEMWGHRGGDGEGTGAGFGGTDECNGLGGHRETCGLKSEEQCPCRRIYRRGTEIAVSPLFLGQMELLCPAGRGGALGKGPRGPLGDPTEMTQPASSFRAEGESQGAQECLAQHSHHLPSLSPPPPPPHRLNLELPEDSSESTTSDTESDTPCSSTMSLDSWSTISCTTITESKTGEISRASTPTPVQKEDWLHASAVQPGLMHPKAGPGEQHDHETCQPCRKEVVRCHRASSVHHQQHIHFQEAAPSHPPEVPKFHSMEMKTSLTQKKSKEALNYFTSNKKEEQKLRLPADGDKPPQNDTASASKVSKQEEEPNMKAVPMVWDLTFLDKAVKNQLECAVEKMYIQKQFGLSEMVFSCEESISATVLEERTAVPTIAPQSPQLETPATTRRRSPQRKHSSSGDRPSALPRPPHHIWICLDMPHIPEVLIAPRDCRKAKKIVKDVHKQLQASRSKQLPDNAGQSRMDPAAEGTGAVPRRRRRRARKDKGCSQDGPVFTRLRPKCIKAPNHNLSATESSQNLAPSATAVPGAAGGKTAGETEHSQNLAPSATAVPGAAGGETVGEKKPSADRAKGQQGQKDITATQQPEGRRGVVSIPVIAQGKLLQHFPGTDIMSTLCSQNHKED